MKFIPLVIVLAVFAAGCDVSPKTLPIYGEKEVVNGDTIFHSIPDFSFLDQDSQVVTNATFAGRAYVADFFFISCPTICPKTTKQMLRIYEKFEDDDRVALLAYTVDPKRDTVGALARYADNLGVKSDKWHFVTGDKDDIYEIAEGYYTIAMEDPDAPGGFNHSGQFVLVDKNRHIRSVCNGTDPDEVDRFMKDIEKLINEK